MGLVFLLKGKLGFLGQIKGRCHTDRPTGEQQSHETSSKQRDVAMLFLSHSVFTPLLPPCHGHTFIQQGPVSRCIVNG
jgi:hypothetical protein